MTTGLDRFGVSLLWTLGGEDAPFLPLRDDELKHRPRMRGWIHRCEDWSKEDMNLGDRIHGILLKRENDVLEGDDVDVCRVPENVA